MNNCFTLAYRYLNEKYALPQRWKGWTVEDMDEFVLHEKKFLASRQHIAFFRSFCEKVGIAKKDDIVLTRKSVGVAINEFTYWVWSEDTQKIKHKPVNKECIILRLRNG